MIRFTNYSVYSLNVCRPKEFVECTENTVEEKCGAEIGALVRELNGRLLRIAGCQSGTRQLT